MISCKEKEEDSCVNNWHPEFIMQRVKIFNKHNDDWIEGIKDANIELIATDENWNPLRDKNGNMIKQIPDKIGAYKNVSRDQLQYIKLYMADTGTFTDAEAHRRGLDSYFILRIDDEDYHIIAKYMGDFCRRTILKSFSAPGGIYPGGVNPWVILRI